MKELFISICFFFKRLFFKCDHKWIYRGLDGGMGFMWRVVECDNCKKEQTSLTHKNSFNDNHTVGQELTKKDFEYFNLECK